MCHVALLMVAGRVVEVLLRMVMARVASNSACHTVAACLMSCGIGIVNQIIARNKDTTTTSAHVTVTTEIT